MTQTAEDIKRLLIRSDATIRSALEIIEVGARRIAFVVDKDEKFLGTIADPDIRRALLNGKNLDSSIQTIFNSESLFLKENENKLDISKKAKAKRVFIIPVIAADGKVSSVYYPENIFEQKEYTNHVVLMLGGLGTRLRPLTQKTPKPMLKVGDKPLLETIINNFKIRGFRQFVFSVSYLSHIIEDYFGNGEKFGVNISYVYEDKPMGTAGSIALIKQTLTEPFFVMNGDLLTKVNFRKMLDYHISNQSMATMGVREYEMKVPYGVVNVDSGSIKSIVEKPTHRFYVSAGVYIIEPSLINNIPKNEYYDMPSLFEDVISKNFRTYSFPIHEYWLDIGRMEDFDKANNEYFEVF